MEGEKKGLKKQNSAVYEEIEPIVKNPLCCGYLKEFCNQQFNVESLQFIMEVDAFVSTLKVDQVSWPYTWREIDDTIAKERNVSSFDEVIDLEDVNPVKYPWPSNQLNQETVRSDLQAIWDSFIANDAQLQICLPNSVYRTTKFRYDHFQRYGPTVFSESLIEPAMTLGRDIIPRFQKTPNYNRMNQMLDDLKINNGPNDLIVPPPQLPANPITDDLSYRYSLDEVLIHPTLYEQFLQYLISIVSAENLYCMRLILLYEEQFQAGYFPQAAETAWKIYKFFIISQSAYQVSLPAKQIRQIAYQIATPNLQLFAPLKKSVRASLMQLFDTGFKRTQKYAKLSEKIKEEHDSRKYQSSIFFNICGCFYTPKIASK